MSATAGCGADSRIEESARAAEKAWSGLAALPEEEEVSSEPAEEEHVIICFDNFAWLN